MTPSGLYVNCPEAGKLSRVTRFLAERKQKTREWRDRVSENDTPLESIALAVLNPEFDLDWGQIKNGCHVVTSDDLQRAFKEHVYSSQTIWLEVLLQEINHLLSLDAENEIENAFLSIDRFTYWPQEVSVKEEFTIMAETIGTILTQR
jgi:hypothetical protein